MRLINADALKKEIRENDPFGGMNYEWYIDHAPTIVPASKWHRVEEELPEIGQIVLVYDEWRRLSICQLDNSYRWLRQGGGWFNGPCACYWMPIEPPQEE